MEIFNQILELDDEDDETHEFSWSMVRAYFEQAEKTFRGMDDAVTKKALLSLSESGHFLKGSSAALGLWRVKESCEKIQHRGLLRDEEADNGLTHEEALKSIQELLKQVKVDNHEADIWLKDFYKDLTSESEGVL
jgi:osomolarity two-component system phosphorelay intermediate protein YPD1